MIIETEHKTGLYTYTEKKEGEVCIYDTVKMKSNHNS